MSVLVIGEKGANVACAAVARKEEEPCVVIQLAKHDQVMEARLTPPEARKLGEAILADAASLMMIQGPPQEMTGEVPWGGSI